MNKLIIFISSLLFFPTLWASPLPQSKSEYCARFYEDAENQLSIQDFANFPENLMAFKNNGGLFNGGVCWWHSRFQRNIFYLAIFRPDLPRPNRAAIKALVSKIRQGNSVVLIPGHHDFEEFSRENEDMIQAELNNWQLYDGVILGGWMDGLKGNTKISPSRLLKLMDELHEYVDVQKKVAYEKLQIKGITAHAWLVVGMKKNTSGYDLGFIDSNNPRMSEIYSYKIGDTSFNLLGYGKFVPYLEFKNEERRLLETGKIYCGLKEQKLSFHELTNQYDRDYDEDLIAAKKIH